MNKEKISIRQALDYEVSSNLLAPWVSIKWLQELLADYLVWKTRRKYKRYQRVLERRDKLNK